MDKFNKLALPFVNGVEEGKKKSNLFVAMIVVPIFSFLVSFIFSYVVFLISFKRVPFMGLVIPFLGMILGVFIWVRFFEKRKFNTIGFFTENNKSLKNYMIGIITGLLAFSIATFIIVSFQGNISFLGIDFNKSVFLFTMLIGYGVQGAAEEILTRGYIFGVVSNKLNVVWGIIINSVIFALLHLGNPGFGLIPFVNIILVGIFFTLMAIITKSLWCSCAIHSMWNFAQGHIFGTSVSGTGVSYNSIFMTTSNNSLVAGGVFGPEGGLAVTITLLLFILICIFKIRKQLNSI